MKKVFTIWATIISLLFLTGCRNTYCSNYEYYLVEEENSELKQEIREIKDKIATILDIYEDEGKRQIEHMLEQLYEYLVD